MMAIADCAVRGLSSTQALPPTSRTRAFTVFASDAAAASLSTWGRLLPPTSTTVQGRGNPAARLGHETGKDPTGAGGRNGIRLTTTLGCSGKAYWQQIM